MKTYLSGLIFLVFGVNMVGNSAFIHSTASGWILVVSLYLLVASMFLLIEKL